MEDQQIAEINSESIAKLDKKTTIQRKFVFTVKSFDPVLTLHKAHLPLPPFGL